MSRIKFLDRKIRAIEKQKRSFSRKIGSFSSRRFLDKIHLDKIYLTYLKQFVIDLNVKRKRQKMEHRVCARERNKGVRKNALFILSLDHLSTKEVNKR